MQGITICMINQKGGCGKSSTCYHLSGYLARAGHKILLIDADPQGSLSQAFFGSALVECLEPVETLAAIFADENHLSSIDQLIVPTSIENISIVRANYSLAGFNVPAPENTGMKQFGMQSLLDGLVGFDFVLIDCPPNLYQCSWNAMIAADYVMIPVQPETFGTQGLKTVYQALKSAQQLNPRLQMLGQVITKSDRRLAVHRVFEKHLRQHYGHQVFSTVVPEASAYKVAIACQKPVAFHCSWSRAAKQMKSLGREMMQRIELSTRQHQRVA